METRGSSAIQPGKRYTLEEWRGWGDDQRWELIRGIAFSISPAPRLKHQRLVMHLATQLSVQLAGHRCEPFIAPVDVFPFPDAADDRADTVVQPDLMIVCDESKCRDEGIFGAPDWILEVLSASTAWKDQTEKKQIYEESGVVEYWIVNPDTLDLIVYLREGARFAPPVGKRLEGAVPLSVLPEVSLSFSLQR